MKNIFLGIVGWFVLVLIFVAVWLLVPTTIWQYIFFLRIPILMGLLLLLLPAIAKFFLPAMLKNLFVLRGIWQLAVTILGATVAAVSVIFITFIILENAPDRFGIPPLVKISPLWRYLLVIILALPTTAAITDLSQEEINKEKIYKGLSLGISFSIIFLFVFKQTRSWLASQEGLNGLFVKIISFLDKGFPKGYIDSTTGTFTAAHINAFAFFLVLLLIYLFIFNYFKPRPIGKQKEIPALLYVMLLISIATLFLGNLTFYFDYFRASVLFFWLLIAVVMYSVFKVDHFFELKKDTIDHKGNNPHLQDFKKVIDKRLEHQNPNERTLVVVCASGGGIQAAGWTTQVLTGLQEVLGTSFTKAIGLISAVSGGSVGTIYYLDRFGSQGYPPDKELNNIFISATEDSLDATGWGLAYPDLWRVIALPLFPAIFSQSVSDRGIALEIDWQGEMQGWENPGQQPPVKSLATWREQVFQGEIPIPILNSTLVEDGRRLLISPMTFGDVPEKKYIDFNSLYGDYDINAVTAARLSATFPYVSPICRANFSSPDNGTVTPNYPSYHLADGGYFDNSGFVTVVEWLNEWLDPKKNLNIRRLLILQINPFPQPTPNNQNKENQGWLMSTLGPLLAIFKVRDSVLTTRNATEVEMLQKQYSREQIDIQYFPIFFPSLKDLREEDQGRFYTKQGEYQPPLSWKLTKKEKEAIKRGWETIKGQKQIQQLKQLWQQTWNL